MTPRTSIITLTEDRPEWLAEACLSIDAQTDSDWEHLIYDRGLRVKADGIGVRQEESKRCVFRSKHFENKHKIFTVGAYWNRLIEQLDSETKYVTILDDDNRKRPTFIEKMIAPMEVDPTVEAVSCGWAPIGERGESVGEDRHWNLHTSMEMLWATNTIDSNAMVFRKSVLDKIGAFDAALTTNEDWHFIIRLARHCKVVHLEDVLLDYRVHEGARSRRAEELGVYANWARIRGELFTVEEQRAGLRAAIARQSSVKV